jgi:photosystem II stability/assembly factor-like uncharacterized protein
MKFTLMIATALVLSFSSFAQKHWEMIESEMYTIEQINDEANNYFKNRYKGKGSGYKQFQRWLYFAKRDADVNGKINWRKNAFNEINKFKKNTKRSGSSLTKRGQSLWSELGPTTRNPTTSWNPGVGRVECISVDPNNSDHILAGAPSGGVWSTMDQGINWTPLTDKLSTLNILGCLISPNDASTYFIGTDQGIFKSTDAGISWTNVFSSSIIRLKADASNPSVLLACGSSGIYKSTNNGDSWSSVESGNFLDLEYHPTDPTYVYAAGRYNIFRSTDSGQSWSQISAGAGSGYGRIAISPAEPNSVWYMQASGNNYGSLSKSTNKGQSFSIINQSSTDYLEGYGWYGIDLAVSAQDPNRIYLGGMELYRSTNGGTSFSLYVPWLYSSAGSKYIHADIHSLEWFGSNLYTGTDGGISISQNSEETFKNLSNGLNVRQFYKIGVGKNNPNVVVGGAQDNGTASTYGNSYVWREWLGADGMDAFVSWDNPNDQIGTSQNGNLYMTTNGGQSQNGLSSGSGNWVTPIVQHPTNSDVFYVGYTSVSKYTFSGGTGQALGTPNGSGKCDELTVSETNPSIMFASKGSTLSKSTNGGTSWSQVATNLGSINYISIHPEDPNYVAVASSGSGKVYVSIDGGTSWNSQKLNLPNLSSLCVAFEKGPEHGLYVGMYSGVYYINDEMSSYIDYQDNLPNVQVNEIEINYIDNRIYAGTYGRGLWAAPTYATSNQIDASVTSGSTTTFCDGGTATLNAIQDNDYTYQWLKNGVDIVGETTSTLIVDKSANYSVEVTSAGETVESALIEVTVLDKASNPSVTNELFCTPSATLILSVDNSVGAIKWYATNSSSTSIFEGNDYTVNLNQTTSFFVEQSSGLNTLTNGGALDKTLSAGANHAGGYGLEFDVFKNMILKTVNVYAVGIADRNFVLKDGNSNELENVVINVPEGQSTVTLNWSIPQGSDYIISCEKINGVDVDLFRNSAFTNFPFAVSNILTITNGTASGSELEYYYYFYNWFVEEAQVDCPSDRVEITATIDLCVGISDLEIAGVQLFPNPMQDALTLKTEGRLEKASWEMFDVQGKLVAKGQLIGTEIIDVSKFKTGLYVLRLTTSERSYTAEIKKR